MISIKGMSYGSSKDSCMQKLKSFKALFETDIVTYRGNVCNQKGSPRVHWIIGRLHAKNQGPKSKGTAYG